MGVMGVCVLNTVFIYNPTLAISVAMGTALKREFTQARRRDLLLETGIPVTAPAASDVSQRIYLTSPRLPEHIPETSQRVISRIVYNIRTPLCGIFSTGKR